MTDHPSGEHRGARRPTTDKRRPRTPQARLGASGERLAAHLLETQGYRLVANNWRCIYGELDLIAEDGPELVFVEVKTRRGSRLGSPEEAITAAKRQRLILAAQSYLAESGAEQRPYRFDVVAIELGLDGQVGAVRLHRRAIPEE
jgi:putative endonuclease